MPETLDALSRAQRAAVTHPGGPLLIVAGAGTGKTSTICRRFAWLVEEGTPAEQVLALTFSTHAAAEMRERLETLITSPYEELHVQTFHGFCSSLLADEALEAGVDPFFSPVTPADRLALLLDRIDELTLRHHEIRGNPAPLLASFVARIDRLKDEMVSADDYVAYAERLAEDAGDDAARAGAARELEFARLYADHDRLLGERGALDFGDLILRAFRMLHTKAHVRERTARRFAHVLVDEYQDTNFAQGMLLRLLVEEHRNVTVVGDDDQAIYRFRGASQKNLSDFEREFPDATVVRLERNYRSGKRILEAAHAVVAPVAERIDKTLTGAAGGEVRFWRCSSERAQAQAVAAEAERLDHQGRVAVGDLRARALGEERGRADRLRPGGARAALPHLGRRRLLPARRGARRARLAARAGRPDRLRRGGAGAVAAAGRAALGGHRAAHPARAPAQARHAVGDRRRRSRGRSSHPRDATARRRSCASTARRRQRLRGPPAGRVRAAADRADRACAASRCSPPRPTRSSGCATSPSCPSSPPPTCAASRRPRRATSPATWRPWPSRGCARRRRAGPGSPAVRVMTMHAAKGLEFDHAFVLGLSAGRLPGPSRKRRDEVPGRAAQGDAAAGRRATRRPCAGSCTWR